MAHPISPSSQATLRADVATIGDIAFVALQGELDLAGVPRVREVLRQAERATAGPIFVDLGGLRFVDLRGMRSLSAAVARLGGRLRLLPAAEPVQQLFDLIDATHRLPFAPLPATR